MNIFTFSSSNKDLSPQSTCIKCTSIIFKKFNDKKIYIVHLLHDGEDNMKSYSQKKNHITRGTNPEIFKEVRHDIYSPWRHGVLFALSRDFQDQSNGALYTIIILRYNKRDCLTTLCLRMGQIAVKRQYRIKFCNVKSYEIM